ncbi:hypothetical protein [Herbaspirillum sp. YR522]|uniref:hypothetical protein n=1 Tax=Herbaspirillum sp. YR522 TaxID=1144342 RepID=UPI00026FB34F|nr:hypothetical protein [Herbaspirillum sp. YR522]EJN07796.1 hypothetical protein PMI40_01692 [Herbaspirillum sp. YR522]
MEQVETMKVKSSDSATQGDFVLINKSDFNAEVHELFDPNGVTKKAMNVEEIKAALAAKNIVIPDGVTKKADLQALLDAANQENK